MITPPLLKNAETRKHLIQSSFVTFLFFREFASFATVMLEPCLVSSDIEVFKRKGFVRADFESF